MSISGLDGLNPLIQDINFLNATEDDFNLTTLVSINNPSQLSMNFSNIWIDIYYNGAFYVGNASYSLNYTFSPGNNQITLNTTFGGNKTTISSLLEEYIQGDDVILTLNSSITLELSQGRNYTLNETIQYTFRTSVDLVTVNDVDIGLDISFTLSWPGGIPSIDACTITISVDITLHNPMSFDINITYFTGEMCYIDTGASSITYLGVTFISFPDDPNSRSLGNATIDEILTIPGDGQIQDNADVNPISNVQEGVRLYDECFQDDDLEIDILDGILKLQIGAFNITLTDVDLYDIRVPRSALTHDLPI